MRVRLCEIEAHVEKGISGGAAQVELTRFVNVEMEQNTKPFLLLLKRQLISKSHQVRNLGKSLEGANPFAKNLLQAGQKGPKKHSKVQKLASQIAQEDDLGIFGFVQKEVAFLEESKAVLEYMKEVQRNSDYCRDLGALKATEESQLESERLASQKSVKNIIERKKANFVSFYANQSHLRSESVQVNSTPTEREKQEKLREQPNSDSKSKPRKDPLDSFRKYSHVREKIGENKYIYRLARKVETQPSQTSPGDLAEEGAKLESEGEMDLMEQPEKLEMKSVLHETEQNSRFEQGSPSETVHREQMGQKMQDAHAKLERKEEEIERLKEENKKLQLANREMGSENQVRLSEVVEGGTGTDAPPNRTVLGNQGKETGELRESTQRQTGRVAESVEN